MVIETLDNRGPEPVSEARIIRGMVGREMSVLFEKPGRLPGQMVGKSDYLHAVFVDAPQAQVGDLMRVRITASAANSLAGALVA